MFNLSSLGFSRGVFSFCLEGVVLPFGRRGREEGSLIFFLFSLAI